VIAPAVAITADGAHGAGGGYRVAYGHVASPFTPALLGYLAERVDDAAIAVYDANTGITWDLRPGDVQYTASIIKVDVMADALAADRRHGGIPPNQAALIPPMIEVSDNSAAVQMWNIVGGAPGLSAFDRVLGLTSTTPYPGGEDTTTLGFAFTTTTAADMVKVVRTFAFANPILDNASRAYGLSLMHNIRADQVWGVPAGAPGGSVALKTGFITPAPGDAQVNSIGYVAGGGRNYVFAILTDGNPDEQYGEATINTVASLVYDALPPG
jgi:beta-lactamase class A